MTYREIEFLKNNLREELAECIYGPQVRQKLPEPSDRPVEILEQVQITIERDLRLILRRRVDARITELREALDHVNDNDYGICLDCGKKIPVKRLLARPGTRLCVACQAKQERKQRFRIITRENYKN